MAATSRLISSAVVGSLLVGGSASSARAQVASRLSAPPSVRVANFAAGSLHGVVQDERGEAIAGVVVSALGATTTVAVTDDDGRFEFGLLAPGPYLVRAHLSGFVAPRATNIRVLSNARTTADIALRRAGAVLAAGVGVPGIDTAAPASTDPDVADTAGDDAAPPAETETVWRIRHARRGILKEATIPSEWLVDAERPEDKDGVGGWTGVDVVGRAIGSARVASSFFADTPFSGQLNLLTSGSFDSPDQLLSPDNVPSNIAYARLGAPLGDQADWAVRGAVTQSDISSWTVAGSYATRAPARHRYDLGLSYATQRYDGGNPLTLGDIADGSRNAGNVYGYDSFAVSPALTVTYGAAFARYDYLADRSLLSPRVEVTMSPAASFRVRSSLSRRALAPGAEEFLPPSDSGLWLPPQRTFSSLNRDRSFDAERTTHLEAAVEKDLGASTVSFRAFRQQVDGQLVTLFGTHIPGEPDAKLGHYIVGTAGDAEAQGCSVGFRSLIASRVRGSVEYTMADAELQPSNNVRRLMMVAPSAVRTAPERLHDLSTSVEADVPETATRVLVLYRVSNGFAQPGRGGSSTDPTLGGRFDVQIHQQLPFMNFSNARWEMLLAVRNFFRESGTEQSVYDELLVVQPPKRVVGGVTLRF